MTAVTRFTPFDIHLFREGKHFSLYEKMGSHLMQDDEGRDGTYFAVWAPNARGVSVVGVFNQWNKVSNPLVPRWDGSGIWEGFIVGANSGQNYKYCIASPDGRELMKGDPFARLWETPPQTATTIWNDTYNWSDTAWMEQRKADIGKPKPQAVYEVHLGSWLKLKDEQNRILTYREMADRMVQYVLEMGYTHVELMPVMEHPYTPSWGYQITGYFAPSSRFGAPQDFKYLVDTFHQNGIGVILDWVPSHFPEDAHGLAEFDGTRLYEHADPRKGYHPDWKSLIFNYGRFEVRSFLISNALFWLDQYHIDGLRVDAVASMLYLDYSRKEGEWLPNMYGGNQNLEAVSFLREFNEAVYMNYPDAMTIAEESTAWPGISKPTYDGGLGFGQKWMMGWMNDTLRYMARDPLYRSYHQNEITFSISYAFSENFMLPFSHDEVVHGKGSMLERMPGDKWRKFANLRMLYTYMYTHPGTKLMFMGCEFGQAAEWSHDRGLDWWALQQQEHLQLQNFVKTLNHFYKNNEALYHFSFQQEGFEWISGADTQNCVITYLRKSADDTKTLLVVCNFTPNVHEQYQIGVPTEGTWVEVLNSDDAQYGGSGQLNAAIVSEATAAHGKENSIHVKLAPLATMIFECKHGIKKKITKKSNTTSK